MSLLSLGTIKCTLCRRDLDLLLTSARPWAGLCRFADPSHVYLDCATLLDKHPPNGDLGREIIFLVGLLALPMGVAPHLKSLTSRVLLLVKQTDAGKAVQAQ